MSVALCQHPGNSDLCHAASFRLRYGFDRRQQVQVLFKIAFLKSRMGVTAVGRKEIVAVLEGAGEETAPKRTIGDKANAKLAQCRQDLVFDVARPQGIFGLQGGQRMHSVGAADGTRASLAESEVADLALFHQAGHGADRVFNGDVRVDAMDIVEIDHIDPHALEAGLAGDRDIVGPAIDAAALTVGTADIAEFRGNEIFVAPAFDRLANKLFVYAGGISVGCVEQVDAELGGTMDSRDRLDIVGNAVIGAHARAP